jgi:hypothetical protein
MSAIFLISEDIERTEWSIMFKTYGPNTIPVISIPINPGSFTRLHIKLRTRPKSIIIATLNNIIYPPKDAEKADTFCVDNSQKSSAFK